ncbi:MAG TPA: LuxR C-terminal-related transcriptional regulator, partial [Streptosporangiaceae bacterium]|nr:LuxR C-terminal-related transcriptional regulator [Streptosporangiaceae bacterium]
MSTPVRATDRDLRALAAIVSQDRADVPAEGLPPSLLAALVGQIRCDALGFGGFDPGRQMCWFGQEIPPGDDAIGYTDLDQAYWEHYWNSQPCSYAARTGDLRSVIKISDFYSTRQWHSTGMYTDYDRPLGEEHCLMLCLPEAPPRTGGPGRTIRLYLSRGPGPDFSERDRALLTLLRPHLHQAYLDAERRRHPLPRLTLRQKDLLQLVAAGHTNTQIARRLGITEGTVRTHLENIYERLQVSSR